MPPRSLPPTKKRKIEHDSGFAEQIKAVEAGLIEAVNNNRSLNALADLLSLVQSTKDPLQVTKAIYATYRVLVVILTKGKLGLGGDEAAKLVKTWLLDQLDTYVDFLATLLKDEEKTLRISAIQILLSLQKHLSTSYSTTISSPSSKPRPQFHLSHFRKIVAALLLCPPSRRPGSKNADDQLLDPDVANLFYETWFSVHDDIRWFFLRESATLLTAHPRHPMLPLNLLSMLERLTTFPTEPSELNAWWVAEMGIPPPKPKRSKTIEGHSDSDHEDKPDHKELNENDNDNNDDDDWRKYFEDEPAPPEAPKAKAPGIRLHQMTIHQSLHSLASHRAVFTRTWLDLLPRLSNYKDAEKLAVQVLNIMHRGILPHLTRPVLIMDWIGACVDYGGSVGLLGLNALFILMKDYNLDYPSFYTRLYAFLDRDILHLKHRARFFRLLELFLSSTHLPATLLASFIKRLSRLTLTAPPAAIVMIIPFTYNTLKKHPALMTMIHNTNDAESENTDPFLPGEANPTLTRALESSLWELVSHRTHYHSAVSALCKIFAEPFTKPSYPLEDFLDHTYATLFDTEVKRKIKKEPSLALDPTKGSLSFPTSMVNRTTGPRGNSDQPSQLQQNIDIVGELWSFV